MDLAEEQRLQEAPDCGDGMKVLHRPTESKGGEHIAVDIEVAREIGLANAAFIETAQRTQRLGVLEPDLKARCSLSEKLNGAVGKGHLERYGRVVEPARVPAEQRTRELWDRRLRRQCIALQGFGIIVHASSVLPVRGGPPRRATGSVSMTKPTQPAFAG